MPFDISYTLFDIYYKCQAEHTGCQAEPVEAGALRRAQGDSLFNDIITLSFTFLR
jgi:hypothetical protein